ncbi:MAG: sugar ABC transporter substrate-binding protein [Anaerolineales bacterium]|nr:sugar ABC transporter substrate-binding protein [Anaerolineales bacterium]
MVVSVLSATQLVGAASNSTQEADSLNRPSQQDATVSFMVSGDPAEKAAYETLVAEFEKVHPEIDIELIHVADDKDFRTRLGNDFAAGTPPDVFLINFRRYGPFVAKDQIEPVGPYLEQSEVIHPEDFYPIAIEAFTWTDGTIMCIPQNISNLVVYYNQDLFDAAGVAYPSNDWTWEDFLTAAEALTLDTDGDGTIDQYGVGIEPSIIRLAPFVWQNGGQVVTGGNTDPTGLALDLPEAREALEWFVALQTEHHVVPDAEAEAAEESESRFINGHTAMFFNSRRGVPTYREIEGFAWDVAPLPVGKERASILHSDAYCMASATENKDAAWTFIEYANSEIGQTVIAGTGRTVPSLISVAESDAFLDPMERPANSQVYLDAAEYLRIVPTSPTWIDIEGKVNAELEQAFYGNISIDEFLDNANERTAGYFSGAEID